MGRRCVRTLGSILILLNLSSPFTYGKYSFDFSEKSLNVSFKSIEYKGIELSAERLRVIKTFLMMATIPWKAQRNIDHWNPKLNLKDLFKSESLYYGIPYSQSSRYTSLPVFLQNLEMKNGKSYYVGPSNNYLGSDCSSAVMYAFKETVDPFCDFLYTGGNSSGKLRSFEPVGSYNFSDEIFEKVGTLEIVKSNGENTLFKSYEKLLPGDIVLKHVKNKDGSQSGHVRLVLSVDEEKKVLICADQTGVNVKGKLEGQNEKSTWQIGKVYSFEELFKDGYIPLANTELLKLEKKLKMKSSEAGKV